MAVEISSLAQAVGEDAVSTAPDVLDSYSNDAWAVGAKRALRGEHPLRPEAVVRASIDQQVEATLTWAYAAGVPVTPRGLGSAVTGASVPCHGGIVLDLSGLTGVVELNETDLTVTARAGTRGTDLEQVVDAAGYTLGHSPQSLALSSVGGWVATRATGQFSSRYGGIEDLLCGLTVVSPFGETMRLPAAPRPSVGPDLRQLFLGAEGTLGVITQVTVKIFPRPEHRVLEALRFPDVHQGLEAMRAITHTGLRPLVARLYDEVEAPLAMGDSTFDGCALFLGSAGARTVAEAEHAAAATLATAHGGTPLGPEAVQRWLDRRFDYADMEEVLRIPGGVIETIEVAHRWSRIHDLYLELTTALRPLATVLGHFSHVYPQGTSLYLILLGQESDSMAAEARLADIWDTAMRICLRHDAAIAHHHGVGLARLPYLREALGDAGPLLARLKQALDPENLLNPGKLAIGD